MNVIERGQGPAVLLLHGCPSAVRDFEPVIESLSKTHRVLAPELPGYGKSPALEPYSLQGVEDLLIAALRERGIERVSLVGFSFGTYRSFRLALGGKVAVDAIVGLGSLGGLTPQDREGFKGFARLCEQMGDTWDQAFCRQVGPARFLSPAFLKAHPESAEAIQRWFDVTSPRVVMHELDAAAQMPDLYDRLAGLKAPVTLRVGTLDAATPPPYSEALAKVLPHATLQKVEGCGHALLIEDLPNTLAAIRAAVG